MTIGGSTGLGSDLARVQQESFNSLVNQDCKRIGNAITSNVIGKIVKKLKLGDAPLCKFIFTENDIYSSQDYLDMALKLNQLGVKIDTAKLKKTTNIDFIDDTEAEWQPTKEDASGDWSPDDKEQLKKELEEGGNK